MRFVIVTGLSGAGKTEATKSLEDIGYFCVDNLPPKLIPKFAEACNTGQINKVALVMDIRGGVFFDDLFESLEYLRKNNFKYEILFLDCSDEVLVKRFKQNRRSHPLSPNGRVLTGINRVIKAGIFSDLNNLKVYSILNKEYSEFFGFTENDVIEALKYFNIEYELPEVKSWYDGYRFGNSELYNPWSILNFLHSKELEPYWVGTSENFLIKNVLKEATSSTNDILEKLYNGDDVEEAISGTSDLSILMDSKEVWELLLFSGYLTVKEKIDSNIYSLRLPNKEIKNLFKK